MAQLRSPQRAGGRRDARGGRQEAPTIDARRRAGGETRARRFNAEPSRPKSQRRRTPIAWARPPQETPLGVAVEGLAAFRRMACTEPAASESELLRCPGRFAVACGLALAGLKRAALQVNLLAGQQQGMLSRASRLIRSHGDRPAWGLDLGMSGLKAVKLSWNETTRQATVEAAVLIEHAKSLGNALNEADEHKLIADTLAKFLERHRPKAERICVGLPGRMALVRQFELPPVEPAKTPKLIEFEAQQQFPFPLEQLAWDYQFLDEAGGEAKRLAESARQAVAPRAVDRRRKPLASRRFLDDFRRQNIPVDMLQTDFVALHNFLAHEYLSASGDSPAADACPAVAAVDIGCNVTNLVVSSPQSLWFRSLRRGGPQLHPRAGQGVQAQHGAGGATEAIARIVGTIQRSLRGDVAGVRGFAERASAVAGRVCRGAARPAHSKRCRRRRRFLCCTACFDACGTGGSRCRPSAVLALAAPTAGGDTRMTHPVVRYVVTACRH